MAPKYKLIYFNVTGLGEPIRYIFSYGNLDFEDFRIEFSEWEQYKPSVEFGKVPVLEVDGKKIHQTGAICRYLSKKVGLAGKTEEDALDADIIVDTITDFRLNYTAYFREKDEKIKAEKLEEIKKTTNPFYLERLEKIVKENGGYFVNNQLTWADLFFASVSELMGNLINEPILDNYPSLKALKEKVDAIPSIAAYRDKRPKTNI